MRFRWIVLAAVLLCSSQVLARAPKRNVRAADPAYESALAAANRFLHAWQTQDHETGIMMLTDTARQQASRDQMEEFFSPTGDAAFEIERGKKLNAREYSFPVVLFGLAGSHDRAHVGRVLIVKAGRNDWAVDRLP